MRKTLKIVTVVTAMVIVAFGWMGSDFATVSAKTGSATASRALYVSNCARCHGGDGRADTESGRLYDVPDISGGRLRRKSNKRLTNIISKGGGSMPSFGKKLTKTQIASLVAYVRSL